MRSNSKVMTIKIKSMRMRISSSMTKTKKTRGVNRWMMRNKIGMNLRNKIFRLNKKAD